MAMKFTIEDDRWGLNVEKTSIATTEIGSFIDRREVVENAGINLVGRGLGDIDALTE